MKNRLTISTLLLLLIATSQSAEKAMDDYNLVWADEFEIDGEPNPQNWTYEHGFVRNNELQWYQPENATCQHGILIIEGRKERKPNPHFKKDSKNWRQRRHFAEYTSSSLITQGLHQWQYGRFEIKARIQAEDGLWPAIWLLGTNGEWPYNGEVDIMEFYDGSLLANVIWGSNERWKPRVNSEKKPIESFGDLNWDKDFHIWRLDWDEESIKLYIDDILLNTINLSSTFNPPGSAIKHPFRQPHYLLINLAIGGHAGGDPSKTTFPAKFEIDYIRVYKK